MATHTGSTRGCFVLIFSVTLVAVSAPRLLVSAFQAIPYPGMVEFGWKPSLGRMACLAWYRCVVNCHHGLFQTGWFSSVPVSNKNE
ncbi:MAG: hypothetical protein HOK97_00450 [Deltaproteobacteria bacterium]|nr:hypothetical protein [Deltaproteobacteria bacterium]